MHPFEHSPLHPEHPAHTSAHKEPQHIHDTSVAHYASHDGVNVAASAETTTQAEPRAPQIGDIVHYVETLHAQHRAAIIVAIPGHTVDLQVFHVNSHGSQWVASVPYDEHGHEDTWHYPEKA